MPPLETLVPEGQYRAIYLRFEKGAAYGRKRWFAWFRITEGGPHLGKPLPRFYNALRGPSVPRSSNLGIDFMTLIGRRPPANLRPDQFLKGVEVLVRVETVRHRIEGKRRIEIVPALHYSKIAELIRITAGTPPCSLVPSEPRTSHGPQPSPALQPEPQLDQQPEQQQQRQPGTTRKEPRIRRLPRSPESARERAGAAARQQAGVREGGTQSASVGGVPSSRDEWP